MKTDIKWHLYKVKSGVSYMLVLGGLICLAVGVLVFSHAFDLKYVQLLPLIFGLFFIVFGITCILSLFKTYNIKVSKDEIILEPVLGIM